LRREPRRRIHVTGWWRHGEQPCDVGGIVFTDFGTLLRVLRHRARLTQRQLGIAVGYSEAQISRLEQGRRRPDPAVVAALFLPALRLGPEPELAARLHELALSAA
jgi:DNA-binding XRE family transcriptional regulator